MTVNKIQENVQGTININVKSLAKKHLSDDSDSNKNETNNENKSEDNKAGKDSNVTIKVLAGGDTVYSKSVPRSTENLNVTFEGKGNVTVKVYINDILANGKSYTLDLNSSNRILNIE